jgi:hypothetical protein
MPAIDNPRHELFAQALFQGKTQDEAYVSAGFKRHDGNAARLSGNERIQARLAELTARAAANVSLTKEWVIEQLIDNARFARAAGDIGPSNQALSLLGKEIGMFVERTENVNFHHDISNHPPSEDEWEQAHTAH